MSLSCNLSFRCWSWCCWMTIKITEYTSRTPRRTYTHALRTLETQLGEEPFVFARLVLLFEFHSGLETVDLAFCWIFKIFRGYFIKRDVCNTVSRRHNMVVVEKLQNAKQKNVMVNLCFLRSNGQWHTTCTITMCEARKLCVCVCVCVCLHVQNQRLWQVRLKYLCLQSFWTLRRKLNTFEFLFVWLFDNLWWMVADRRVLTFKNGLILDFFFNFALPIFFVTLRGYRSIPATSAWPNCLSDVPSSKVLTITALRPA